MQECGSILVGWRSASARKPQRGGAPGLRQIARAESQPHLGQGAVDKTPVQIEGSRDRRARASGHSFQFPGHTWLQQDTQIYAPALEHQRDPTVLRTTFWRSSRSSSTLLYDEAALALRGLTGLGFREVLAFEQLLARALRHLGPVPDGRTWGLPWARRSWLPPSVRWARPLPAPRFYRSSTSRRRAPSPLPLLICAVGLALTAGISAPASGGPAPTFLPPGRFCFFFFF